MSQPDEKESARQVPLFHKLPDRTSMKLQSRKMCIKPDSAAMSTFHLFFSSSLVILARLPSCASPFGHASRLCCRRLLLLLIICPDRSIPTQCCGLTVPGRANPESLCRAALLRRPRQRYCPPDPARECVSDLVCIVGCLRITMNQTAQCASVANRLLISDTTCYDVCDFCRKGTGPSLMILPTPSEATATSEPPFDGSDVCLL